MVWQVVAIKQGYIGWEERFFLEVQHVYFHMVANIFKYIEMQFFKLKKHLVETFSVVSTVHFSSKYVENHAH